MPLFHNNIVTHTWHWTGSAVNDAAESVSNKITKTILRRNDGCRVTPDTISRIPPAGPLDVKTLLAERISSDEEALNTFSSVVSHRYSVRWVDESQDRCKGILAFRKRVDPRTAIAACLAHNQSQNPRSGDPTALMHFLRVFPEVTFGLVQAFKVGDKVTFLLVKAVADSVLSGTSPLRPEITAKGGGAIAVLIGTMIKSNPDMKAYMRAFRDPDSLDRRMLGNLDIARQHLREASDMLGGRGRRVKHFANLPDGKGDSLREIEVQSALDHACAAIFGRTPTYFSVEEAGGSADPLEQTFLLFSHILRNSDSVQVAYGYIVAGIKLYCDKKTEDYHRNANTAKVLLGLAGAAVSALPPAAPGAAAAVAVGCALADHAADAKIKKIDISISRLVGDIAGHFGVTDSRFLNAYNQATAQGKGYV